jgi:hypothetical protein
MSEVDNPTSGKRERKQTSFFAVEPKPAKKELAVGKGTGMTLAEYDYFCEEFLKVKADSDLVKALHGLLYGTPGKKTEAKKNIRGFSGFPEDVNIEEKIEKTLEKRSWTTDLFRSILKLFKLERSGDRKQLCERLIEYLKAPKDLSNVKRTRKPSTGSTKGQAKGKAEGDNESSDDDKEEEEKEVKEAGKESDVEEKPKSSKLSGKKRKTKEVNSDDEEDEAEKAEKKPKKKAKAEKAPKKEKKEKKESSKKSKKEKGEKKASKKRAKKAISAYDLFEKATKDVLKETKPDLSSEEVSSVLEKMWNSLNEVERQEWVDQAEEVNRTFDPPKPAKAEAVAEEEPEENDDGDEEVEEGDAMQVDETTLDVEEGETANL